MYQHTAMGNEIRVVRDYRREHGDGSIERVKIIRVPESKKFPAGVKYRLHHSGTDEYPEFRYDNSHGYHEVHVGNEAREIAYPGITELFRRFGIVVDRRLSEPENPTANREENP